MDGLRLLKGLQKKINYLEPAVVQITHNWRISWGNSSHETSRLFQGAPICPAGCLQSEENECQDMPGAAVVITLAKRHPRAVAVIGLVVRNQGLDKKYSLKQVISNDVWMQKMTEICALLLKKTHHYFCYIFSGWGRLIRCLECRFTVFVSLLL